MSTATSAIHTPEPPLLETYAICCPHVKVKGNDILESWKVIPMGKIFSLDGEHTMIYCQLCWHALRSHALADIASEVSINTAKRVK